MRSTNRGAVRQADDYYSTPSWCTRAILPHLAQPRTVLDPAAGTGALLVTAREYFATADLFAIEQNTARFKECHDRIGRCVLGDAFSCDWPEVDLILANPPYSLALEFVETACGYLKDWGHGQAAFLLRLAFLESTKRNKYLRHRMPDDIYVLPKRPAFVNNKTDSCAYAWFVWGAKAHGAAARLHVLGV